MSNKMTEVAKILGEEIGEVFTIIISGVKYNYRLELGGLYVDTSLYHWSKSGNLDNLLTGELEIVKKPWVPKEEENYFCVFANGYVGFDNFHFKHSINLYRLKMQNYFRTQQEAEANKDRIMAEFEAIRKEFGL